MKKSIFLWVAGFVFASAFIGNGIYTFRLRSSLKTVEKDVHKNDVLIVGYMYLYKIARYRTDHGNYPKTLQELSPTYISQRYIDQYIQYWSYTSDLEADTFELIEIVEPEDNQPHIYSPEFYGIYNKFCVENALKQREAENQAKERPCEPLD